MDSVPDTGDRCEIVANTSNFAYVDRYVRYCHRFGIYSSIRALAVTYQEDEDSPDSILLSVKDMLKLVSIEEELDLNGEREITLNGESLVKMCESEICSLQDNIIAVIREHHQLCIETVESRKLVSSLQAQIEHQSNVTKTLVAALEPMITASGTIHHHLNNLNAVQMAVTGTNYMDKEVRKANRVTSAKKSWPQVRTRTEPSE